MKIVCFVLLAFVAVGLLGPIPWMLHFIMVRLMAAFGVICIGVLILCWGNKDGRTPVVRPGSELIAAERQRQMDVEKWTPEHDDIHNAAELTRAAMAYADAARKRLLGASNIHTLRLWNYWPWDQDWWRPSLDPVRNLVKAGALIAAEIDRIQRKENKHD